MVLAAVKQNAFALRYALGEAKEVPEVVQACEDQHGAETGASDQDEDAEMEYDY